MKNRIDTEAYRVKKGVKIHLKEWPTRCDQEIEKGFVKETLFPEVLSEMVELQEKLYAENRRGLRSRLSSGALSIMPVRQSR